MCYRMILPPDQIGGLNDVDVCIYACQIVGKCIRDNFIWDWDTLPGVSYIRGQPPGKRGGLSPGNGL